MPSSRDLPNPGIEPKGLAVQQGEYNKYLRCVDNMSGLELGCKDGSHSLLSRGAGPQRCSYTALARGWMKQPVSRECVSEQVNGWPQRAWGL